ncbi:GNAT family N-acetyltransferase [Xenorhabdus sp. XENO-7]|uniref:GNAT family N-acetyltransferase n=1 Tax=Xenorhabdus aichiensis TaxID=3025874 RepID=A0ABT5M8J2_9GAMM|nr:GNAT family N-acetyltransferase [Xenorhabdus aichiensis]MDC9622527.1 GNAT family N-acetyltransferase [Xenorhabdus aichiensis]
MKNIQIREKMKLEFKHLTQINIDDIIVLHNHPEVLRQMPLGSPNFDHEKCLKWVTQKEAQWAQYGYGPWAFVIDNKFAGWGGLQFEEGDADLALVLHPDYWGTGKIIYDEIVRRAFTEMNLETITILLPPSRTRIKGIFRLGFQPDGEVELDGVRFLRFRLSGSRILMSGS